MGINRDRMALSVKHQEEEIVVEDGSQQLSLFSGNVPTLYALFLLRSLTYVLLLGRKEHPCYASLKTEKEGNGYAARFCCGGAT